MSLGPLFTDSKAFYARTNAGLPARKPLYTLAEIADKLGLKSAKSLAAHMSNTTVHPPKATLRCGPNVCANGRGYYDLGDMRKWWAEHLQARNVSKY